MHKLWVRKRAADEVPTPVAVAMADFCRRAGAPAPPAEVREALASLHPAEDFRVRALTDGEPPARPLGPYAVVDVLSGTPPALAAQRESCGYYRLVREVLATDEGLPDRSPPMAAGQPAEAAPMAEAMPPVARETRSTETAAARPLSPLEPRRAGPRTVAERIAPKRRTPGSREAAPPRGRFAQLPSEQPTLEMLSSEQLAALLTQHGHRPALLRALSAGTSAAVSPHALDRALERAGLLEGATASERELLLSTLEEQRGATGRAAWALGVRASELLSWAERLGVTPAVDRIRDRFRREALQPAHWTARLDLLGKRKYLEDLGVTAEFERSVTEDLRRAFSSTEGSQEERTAVLADRLGVPRESLRRSLLRLGLFPDVSPSITPQPA